MTGEKINRGRKGKGLPGSLLSRCGLWYAAIFMLLLFFKCPDATGGWVSRGLDICARRLIPSLFPFMIVSSLLISSETGERLGRLLSKPFGAAFGIRGQGCSALLLGWLCGFPIGARSGSRLYREGRISRSELERIVCVSGVPSPAFLINTVGASLLGNARLGIVLYVVCLLSCIAVGVVMGRSNRGDECYVTEALVRETRDSSAAVVFTRAVSDAALGMLSVCGFVVFFSAFVGALEGFASAVLGDGILCDLLFGFFEITVGMSRITSSPYSVGVRLVACAAVAAWSGLSAHLQVISLCGDGDFLISKYFAANVIKAAIGTLLGLAALLLLGI